MRVVVLLMVMLVAVGCQKKGAGTKLPEGLKKLGGQLEHAVQKSKGSDQVLYLTNKVNLFKRQNGRYPSSLNELVEQGIIDKLPAPPEGTQFAYDPATGKVSLR
ncbi:MAG TPA: hypothetical protein PKX93_05730 [bacterium]|nr:hypothetical protein [bacterium]HPP11260.1 hypothetical protein [bacterium]